MALYVTRPRRDEVRIGRGLPSGIEHTKFSFITSVGFVWAMGKIEKKTSWNAKHIIINTNKTQIKTQIENERSR